MITVGNIAERITEEFVLGHPPSIKKLHRRYPQASTTALQIAHTIARDVASRAPHRVAQIVAALERKNLERGAGIQYRTGPRHGQRLASRGFK